jgi:hypothetical protein
MSPLVRSILGVVIRAALVSLGALLTEHGAAPELVQRLVSGETQQLVLGLVMIGGTIVWSVSQKTSGLRNIVAANYLSPGATLEKIKHRAAAGDIKASDLEP